MLARIRKAQENKEGGFTLIELLVVMIIIGILAAIAIPVFLNQRKKAQDTAVKGDVATLGKEIATYWVDGTAAPTVAISGGRYTINTNDIGKVSSNVAAGPSALSMVGTDATHWCVDLTNSQGDVKTYKYSAQNGLETGACTSATAP
ncbi:MAG: type II secretion system protein [Motilibacteraceae bacterium]